MTTTPKAPKFRIRRPEAMEPRSEDGFGDTAFPGSAKAESDAIEAREAEAGVAAIRREGLTGRQLRMARRLAQKQGLTPSSDFDAVRQLRAMGIDPFDRSKMLEVVASDQQKAAKPAEQSRRPQPESRQSAATPPKNLPTPFEDAQLPGPALPPRPEPLNLAEMERIQAEIGERRRRKVAYLVARLFAFVLLPTLVAFYYFAFVATPSYATKSVFEVQQAEGQGASGGLLGGTAMATSQDSIMVQDFLTSREALLLLNQDHDYRAHFSDPSVDALQRIPQDASNEEVYRHFGNNVAIGYDPTEGVIRMEVSALTPEMSRVFSEALIGYAEERVDQVSARKRADQMRGARESFEEAEARMVAAQQRVLELQEQLGVLDPASETSSIMSQVNTFEVQLSEKRLQLQQLLENRRPNQARVAGTQGDIERLEALIAQLRSQMTNQTAGQGSLASVSSQLRVAEVDLDTRTLMMQEALQQMEAARIEANRQVRFLSLGVAPIPPDEPTYPRVFENTLIALFVFAAIYLLISVTVAVLREQVSN